MKSGRYNVYVHIFRGKGIEDYRKRYAAGLEVNKTPYAFHLADEDGVRVDFSSDGHDRLSAKILRRLCGLDLFHALHNRQKIARADVVWAMTENESMAIAIAALMMLGLVARKPIVSSSVWVINEWEGIPSWRKRLIKRLSRYIDVLTVQSDRCLETAREAFPGSDVRLMHFGVNTEVFRITPPQLRAPQEAITIFAAGNDRTRDWPTLIHAFGGDERFRLRIWCDWMDQTLLAGMENVVRLRDLSTDQFIQEFFDADLSAVSMVENAFSGITFALNSAALGCPVLCTRTGGVPTYFGEQDIVYVPVGDSEAMRDAVLATTAESRLATAQHAQKTFLDEDYSSGAMVRYYVAATDRLRANVD